ncbi:hypothetical protein HOE31_00320 [bacterium]|jgi:hypothetical protein|nr:hypothetical protein [bacterium]MBT4121386.1 hypothetical protein [bacterium]MBT4335063.1 hypothetical protein [bacterium]MBT4495601.1 hypothetical protein [bacterium]MBT4764081.1 hypothetical protein [bacterium]
MTTPRTPHVMPKIDNGPRRSEICAAFIHQNKIIFVDPLWFKFTPGDPVTTYTENFGPGVEMEKLGIVDLHKKYFLIVKSVITLTNMGKGVWYILVHGNISTGKKRDKNSLDTHVEAKLRYETNSRYGEIEFSSLLRG